jgi:hypothetical protein
MNPYYLGFIPVIGLFIYVTFFMLPDNFIREVSVPTEYLLFVIIMISTIWAINGLMGGIR